MQTCGCRRKMGQIVKMCKKIQMNQKETFNGTIKHHHLNLLVSFEGRDDIVHLRKHLGTEDVERRVVKRDSPILGRALGYTYLSILCCCDTAIFHFGCLLIIWFSLALAACGFGAVVLHMETPEADRCGALRYPLSPFHL